MTPDQLIDLFFKVNLYHSWPMKGRGIKYVRPHFDNRTNKIYGITFNCTDGDYDFFVVNENRHRNLNEWVNEWLNNPKPE